MMMNCVNELGQLDKYIVKEILGDGGYSTVYRIQDPNTKEEYAAKVIESYCKNEFKINQILTRTGSPNIIKFIRFSQGDLKLQNNSEFKPFLLLQLASKGNLSDYITCGKNGFSELHSKIIFKEILNGMQVIHNQGICHKDIKPQNILLDTEEYIIKICDFGLSSFNSELQSGYCGTKEYMAPEIIMDKEYDGIKADIFSLGVLLLNLRTSKFLFEQAKISNNDKPQTIYDYIRLNDSRIWKKAEIVGISGLSEEFQRLYMRMVAFNPKERPSIEDILSDKWMKEVEDLSEYELRRVKIEEFKKREEIILSQRVRRLEPH